jgi:hypothetical protein
MGEDLRVVGCMKEVKEMKKEKLKILLVFYCFGG